MARAGRSSTINKRREALNNQQGEPGQVQWRMVLHGDKKPIQWFGGVSSAACVNPGFRHGLR
eukprot:8545230-Alexandrium_andersonii.AAC.1